MLLTAKESETVMRLLFHAALQQRQYAKLGLESRPLRHDEVKAHYETATLADRIATAIANGETITTEAISTPLVLRRPAEPDVSGGGQG